MNREKDSAVSIIDWAQLVKFGRTRVVNPVGKRLGDCFFAFVPVGGLVPWLCYYRGLEFVPESVAARFPDG